MQIRSARIYKAPWVLAGDGDRCMGVRARSLFEARAVWGAIVAGGHCDMDRAASVGWVGVVSHNM